MQAVLWSVSVGFLFLLDLLGALVTRLHDVCRLAVMTCTAFGGELTFTTALNVA